jgi:CheY-like chemotaxis protein
VADLPLLGQAWRFSNVCPKLEDREPMEFEDERSQRKCFLLIAEDDEDDRMFYEIALTDFGCVEFEFVGNGDELIDYMGAQRSLPDAIFLDLNMPLMDGREALQVIRSDPKFKDIPVACFATLSTIADHGFCLSHGASCHTKPVLMSEFSALIQSLIAESCPSLKELVRRDI